MALTPKTQRKHDAIAHVVDRLGTDIFTTHEVFATGQRMVATESWPKGLKAAFKSMRNPDSIGAVLHRHRAFERVDGGNYDGRMRMGSIKTAMWTRR